MIERSCKVLAMVVVAALVAANAFAPRLSHAAMHPHAMAQAAAASHQHRHDHAAKHSADAMPSKDDSSADHANFKPAHNCCLAACAAIAFIFAVIDVGRLQPADAFEWPLTRILRPLAAAVIDHPPRKA